MLKKSLLIFLSISFSLCGIESRAQGNSSIGHIDYKMIFLSDSADRSKIIIDSFRLQFNKDMSAFKSISQMVFDSSARAAFKDSHAAGNMSNINLGKAPSFVIREQIFNLVPENLIYTFSRFQRVNYLIPDTAKYEWTILNETELYLGYNCQKAKSNFKGRVYEVWFAIDIPFAIGPWKLRNLPGAILKAIDSKNEVSFLATSIQINGSKGAVLKLPSNHVFTTKDELAKAIQFYKDNPDAAPSGDVSVTLKRKDGTNNSSKRDEQLKINNAIELGE